MKADTLRFFKKYDVSFFLLATIIFVIGLLNLYSATHSTANAPIYRFHIYKYLIACAAGVFCCFIQPKSLFRYSYAIYLFNIGLLVLVLLMGKAASGGQRWLVMGPVRVQPSEMMKISLILALARFFAKRSPEKIMGLKDLAMPAIIAFIPAFLIIVEPDLGTGLIILLIFAVIVFYKRLKWKTILILGILGLIGGGAMYQFGLKDYQKRRIRTFINPGEDARGSGYNAIQSEIAIGSGQLFGKGFKKSSQASLNYLPENHTDFVFSVFNEEHGFLGSVVLLTLYALLFFRFIWLATTVLRIYDAILVVGLMAIFFWHTVVNMGMVTGLLPIVGLPLPLMSYGGSSLLTFMVCCGIATSISNSRNLF